MAAERLRTALESDELVFGSKPFSATICHFRDAYQHAMAGVRLSMALAAMFALACAAAAVAALRAGAVGWAVLSAVLAALAVLFLAAYLHDMLPIWRALTHTSFLALNQHDRALAGLRDALVSGRKMVLYLRDFSAEEQRSHYVDLEDLLVERAGSHCVLVAISNPTQDPTLRISRIPKLLVPHALWPEIAAALIERADHICVACEAVGEGLAFEIETIRRAGKQASTLVLDFSDKGEFDIGTDFEHCIAVREPDAREALQLLLLKWFGIELPPQPGRPMRRRARESHAPRYAVSRAWLLGWRAFVPRTDWSYHRAWFRVRSGFAYLQAASIQARRAEIEDLQQGVYSMPIRPEIIPADGIVDPMAERYNSELRMQRRINTAIRVLTQDSAWRAIRQRLR